MLSHPAHNKTLVRMQTTLRFVCTAQLGRYAISGRNLIIDTRHVTDYI